MTPYSQDYFIVLLLFFRLDNETTPLLDFTTIFFRSIGGPVIKVLPYFKPDFRCFYVNTVARRKHVNIDIH